MARPRRAEPVDRNAQHCGRTCRILQQRSCIESLHARGFARTATKHFLGRFSRIGDAAYNQPQGMPGTRAARPIAFPVTVCRRTRLNVCCSTRLTSDAASLCVCVGYLTGPPGSLLVVFEFPMEVSSELSGNITPLSTSTLRNIFADGRFDS